jgi:hypothetical protein
MSRPILEIKDLKNQFKPDRGWPRPSTEWIWPSAAAKRWEWFLTTITGVGPTELIAAASSP